MSNVLYEASPSMVRRNPFGTLLMILVILLGFVLVFAGERLLAQYSVSLPDRRIVGIIGIALVITGFLRLMIWWIATKLDRLVINEEELIWTHGLLNKAYTEINMSSVRTVRVTQGVLQRIMDAGDVTIFTSGDIPELVIRGLPNPGAIRNHITARD